MRWPRIAAALLVAVALAAAPVAGASAAPRGVDDFSFDSFAGDYTLDLDSSGRAVMRVVETIVAVFPPNQNRGIIRAIPIIDGEVPLDLEMSSITDENGTPWYYERDDYDGFAEFALGTDEYLTGRTTFVLSYTVHDPIRRYDGTGPDEFYWDINGNGWAQTFDTVSAHVEVGPALAAALTGEHACFLGYYGTDDGCTLTAQGGGFDTSVGPVGPYNTLTVGIAFDGGTVVQPQLPRDSWIVQLAPKVLLGLMFLWLALAVLLRVVVWREPPSGTIIAQYSPPDDSDLLLDANVVKRQPAGLPALFVDFAVRGLVRVVDHKPGEPNVSARRRFSLELVTADGATARELSVLVMLFGASLTAGERVRPGKLDADTGASLYALTATTSATALSSGLRSKPASRWSKLLVRASGVTMIAFVAVGAWAIWKDVLEGNVVWPGVVGIIVAIAIPSVLAAPARLTRRGAQLRDYLLGMKLYLTVAEEERLRMLQSPEGALRVATLGKHSTDKEAVVKLYERLLPYAVLWGVEDQWVSTLQAVYADATPAWLDGDTFDSSVFRSFTSSATSSVRPIASSSSGGGSSWSSSGGSSGSSFSGGGGFAGGGGGGGGGGGR